MFVVSHSVILITVLSGGRVSGMVSPARPLAPKLEPGNEGTSGSGAGEGAPFEKIAALRADSVQKPSAPVFSATAVSRS